MRIITAKKITDTIIKLVEVANFNLRLDIAKALKIAYAKETNVRSKEILSAIIKNANIAKKEKLAICQDTGFPTVFVEIGQDVRILGDLKKAIIKGIDLGYKKASLRNSIVQDPLLRGSPLFKPPMMHFDIIKGNKVKLTVLPKGFGCENKTQLRMFKPTVEVGQIKDFIIESIKLAGADACPPYVVGVGIGGSADYACLLAKKALLKGCRSPVAGRRSKLEQALLKEINKLNIGSMGLGGKATCLAVNIEQYPTHIAGLPVCVNISCHALRSATKVI